MVREGRVFRPPRLRTVARYAPHVRVRRISRLSQPTFRLVALLSTLATTWLVASYCMWLRKLFSTIRSCAPRCSSRTTRSFSPSQAGAGFPYALLEHVGRRSGRAHVTPVGAFPFGDGFVIGLSYGADVDWCRNVIASGHAAVKWRGRTFALERPEIIPMSTAVLQAIPPYFRLPARQLKQFVWLHR